MTRKNLYSALAAFFAMTLAIICSGTTVASAQQNYECCTYTVDIEGITPNCLPITLYTSWSCSNGLITTLTQNYNVNGIFNQPIDPPPLPPCAPACKLGGISLDGITYIAPGGFKQVAANGCCYRVSFGFTSTGCIFIRIRRCG